MDYSHGCKCCQKLNMKNTMPRNRYDIIILYYMHNKKYSIYKTCVKLAPPTLSYRLQASIKFLKINCNNLQHGFTTPTSKHGSGAKITLTPPTLSHRLKNSINNRYMYIQTYIIQLSRDKSKLKGIQIRFEISN